MTAIPQRVAEERSSAAGTAAPRPVVAMTQDDALVAALEELSGQGLAILVVEDGAGLADALVATPHSIALIDAAASAAPVAQLIDSLAAQFPETRLLVAGNSNHQAVLATRIASQRVYRFVHKPASAQRLRLFYDAASRAVESPRSSATQTVEVLQLAPAGGTQGGGQTTRSRLPWILACAAAVLVAGAVWLFRAGDGSAPPPAPQPVKATPIDALIQRADQAFAQSNFIGFDGTSAGELYKQALGTAPEDERARSGYARSVEYGLRSIEDALTLGQLDAADQRIAAVRAVAPRTSRLDFLSSQLLRAREQASADASRKSANEGRQAQLRSQLQDASDAVKRNALLDPPDDSAVSHLRDAERIAPGDAQVLALRTVIAARLVGSADAALGSNQIQTARRLLDAAVILGAETGDVERLRRQADRMTAEAAAAVTAAAVMAKAVPAPDPVPVVAPPAPTSEAPPKKTEPAVVSAATLKRTRAVEPDYPPRELAKGISGWVEMEFSVQRDGSVRDVTVRQAEPAGLFDNAALIAMRRWRFAPVMKDGQPVEQRAWIRMRFTARNE